MENLGCYRELVKDGDLVLCRINAPLVSECFKLLKSGRKASIQGRDIGQGLIKTIEKMKASSIVDMVAKLDDWLRAETLKEQAKRNPREQKTINLGDRHDCLCTFCEDAQSVQDVVDKITRIFSDTTSGGILLSSIHRAKGKEASRVFLLQPKGAEVNHPMTKTAQGKAENQNLMYVAITRSIQELIFVS